MQELDTSGTLQLSNFSFSKSVLNLAIVSILFISLSGCDSADNEQALEEAGNAEVIQTTEHVSAINKRSKRGKLSTHLLIGTGSVQGVYFPVGGVICRLLNRHKSLHNIRCSLESTGGSIYNLTQLREGNFDIVFAQSDWQYHAVKGTSTFREIGANTQLRSVLALEPDPLALIVKVDSEINDFNDLENRSVSFGYARSLQHRIIDDLLDAKGWSDSNFKTLRRMSDAKQVGQLCDDKVEAILLLSSSLTDRLRNLSDDCKLRLVPIQGAEVNKIIHQKPYYRVGKILRGQHLNSENDVTSFGLGATFVAMESTSPKAIYHVVKEIVENFKDFQSLHPSLKSISKRDLAHAGLTAPLHPGAIRYYKEARLLK